MGQDEALSAIGEAVRLSRAGLQNDRRPLASFLMAGSTGTGKTETCKALANFLFDSESALIQLNMSEYAEQHSIARLIGAPPGYVGHEEAGQLTEQVRRKPYSIVLFDEIEKANRSVQMMLLQILEEGKLQDSQGRDLGLVSPKHVECYSCPLGLRKEAQADRNGGTSVFLLSKHVLCPHNPVQLTLEAERQRKLSQVIDESQDVVTAATSIIHFC